MWILSGAFYCHISDPKFGATYATLFGAMLHIGSKWSITISMTLVDFLSFKSCSRINVSIGYTYPMRQTLCPKWKFQTF